jgi:hypothetical protein
MARFVFRAHTSCYLTVVWCHEYIYIHGESGRWIVVAVALAAASTHSTLTPYLAIPLAVIGTAIAFIRRRRR